MNGPLSGITVLDVATVLAAPVTATILGDFGAEVIKVEDPDGGDFTRGVGGGRSPGWLQEGRNKKSVTVNLREPDGQAIVHELVGKADVVVANFRPSTLEKYRLTPEVLAQLNPNAVLVYLSGYGLTGPYRDRGAFDRIASAYSGLTYVTGEPEQTPIRSGYSVIDYMGAYLAAFATMTALYHRDLSGGGGQVVDLALYEAGLRASEDSVPAYGIEGRVRERSGNRNPYIVPATDFDSADGRRVSVHAGTDPLFRRLASAMGDPELAEDPRFATKQARYAHQDDLYPIIGEWVSGRKADEVVTLLSESGIPASKVMSVADLFADSHCRERGSILEVEDPEHGLVPMVAPVPRLSATPGEVRWAGPKLGEHTDEVLQHLAGLLPADIDALRRRGVI